MPITTTEYANFDKKAFFDNREWLNQENWQMYFGGSLPSGMLVKGRLESDGVNYSSALSRQVLSNNYIGFRPGSVLLNGIFATYEGGTSIPVIQSEDIDRLFVARVFNTAGNVKIVAMTKVAAEYGYTPVVFAKMLLQDESIGCTRNETTYDIPLCYEVFGNDVYDLRRLIYLPGKSPDIEISFSHDDVTNVDTTPDILYGRDFVQIYGGMNYNVNFDNRDTAETFFIYPNPSCSEKQSVVKLVNYSSVTKQIRIPLLWKGLPFSYTWLESWDVDPNNRYLYKDLISGDRITMIFIPNGHTASFDYTVTNKSAASGGGIELDDYYTKQEIATLMQLKANVTEVEDALATKENISNLGELAYVNKADYVTQIENKPILGALASKDKTILTSDVTGILPIANGGTGASNLGELTRNLFSTQTIFYVDANNGDDNNDGNEFTPFATIGRAISACGYFSKNRIYINSGIYDTRIYVERHKFIEICPMNKNAVIYISPTNSNPVVKEAILVDGGRLSIYDPFTSTGDFQGIITIRNNNLYDTVGVRSGGHFSSNMGYGKLVLNSNKQNCYILNVADGSKVYANRLSLDHTANVQKYISCTNASTVYVNYLYLTQPTTESSVTVGGTVLYNTHIRVVGGVVMYREIYKNGTEVKYVDYLDTEILGGGRINSSFK